MPAKRQRGSLAGLLSEPASAPGLPAAPARSAHTAPGNARTATPEVQTLKVRTPEVRTPVLPKYKRLERKEALLWPDQLGELSMLRRLINRRRAGAGERITENTLIRVAVALLISRAGELSGTTEEELRGSLGLER